MKKIVFSLLIFIVLLCGCNENRETPTNREKENTAKWNDAYADFLEKKQYDLSDRISFIVRDINGNGVPELIVSKHGTYLEIYTYDKEKVILVGENEFYTGTIKYLLSNKKDYHGIFLFHVGGGLEHYDYITCNNNVLKIEELWNKDFTGISKELGKKRKEIEEISDDKDLITESKKVVENEKELSFDKLSTDNINKLRNVSESE